MKKSVHVPLSWTVIDWHPDETWKKTTLHSLANAGADIKNIARSVYVIRLNGNYAIHYPDGESPVVYVGEGRFGSRINSHRKWAAALNDLVGEYMFQVCLATPRVQKNPDAYRDCEVVLLKRFGEKFGSAPLWNKQFESRLFPHHEYSLKSLDYALCKRSGAKYKWAIRPMRSSIFFQELWQDALLTLRSSGTAQKRATTLTRCSRPLQRRSIGDGYTFYIYQLFIPLKSAGLSLLTRQATMQKRSMSHDKIRFNPCGGVRRKTDS